ncbi:DNA fragmentation factor subunit beta [Lates japonicus]|uniref:DNAation factor subunit beta n=1 Tax=Lates japonicus TaxID=270547 RepID=A0AAD3M1F9_LATJO|nr:DNA fragmentation factor subunit beta [Lates japonicus]
MVTVSGIDSVLPDINLVYLTFPLHGVSRIEKKRTIIPALLEALQNHRTADVNLTYFYRLLFTRENLKLVHIVCHKKGAHNLLCDSKRIFRKATNTEKESQKARGKKRRLK